MKLTVRYPRPVVVDIDPAAVVIRRPAPRFVADPRPAVRRTPRPMPIAIRSPVSVSGQHSSTWPPDPAKLVAVVPIAVGVQIFCAPDVFVVVLDVVLQTLREITLAIVYPIVDRIR